MDGGGGATGVFQVPGYGAPQAAVPTSGGTRRVPQWVFLHQLFNHVLVKDETALGASGASTKTQLPAARAAGCAGGADRVVAMIGATVSFFGNARSRTEVMEAAAGDHNCQRGERHESAFA